jgi:hypothetical protein
MYRLMNLLLLHKSKELIISKATPLQLLESPQRQEQLLEEQASKLPEPLLELQILTPK